MKIGINALYLIPGKVGGTEIYLRNLVANMAKQAGAEDEILLFVNRESLGIFDLPGITVIPCPVAAENRPRRILWEQVMLPRMVSRLGVDILLSAGMTAPFFCSATSVLVIHDLQHVNQPKNFLLHYLFFLRSIIYASARSADGIVAISGTVKDDLVRLYRLPSEAIEVIHHGVDHGAFRADGMLDVSTVRTRYGLPVRFILYAASSLPHKNHERLFRAFQQVLEKQPGLKLVLIGARDKGAEALKRKIASLGLVQDVLLLGWIPARDVPSIYRASEVFVYPTLHEGFGLPVLEAMACGVPVVCSRIEPLLEVAGDAACFVDPRDPSDILRGITAVTTDSALRTDLARKGLARAAQFTWETTARKTFAFLLSIHAKRRLKVA